MSNRRSTRQEEMENLQDKKPKIRRKKEAESIKSEHGRAEKSKDI